jgi:hypothetical protein
VIYYESKHKIYDSKLNYSEINLTRKIARALQRNAKKILFKLKSLRDSNVA